MPFPTNKSAIFIPLHNFALCVVMLIPLAMITACQKQPQQTTQTQPENSTIQLLNADIVTAKTERYQPSIEVTGTLQTANKTTVQPQSAATVNAVFGDIGNAVNKGDILVKLNTQDSESRVVQARANLSAAQAQYQVVQSLAQKNKILYTQGFISQIEFERSQADAKAQHEQVKAARASLNIAEKATQDMVLTAPISGVIATKQVEVGQMVTPTQVLFTIVDPTDLEFAASVPSEAQNQLVIGQHVPFTVNGITEKFIGQISRIAPEVNSTNRQLMIYIKVHPDSEQNLRSGMFATGKVDYGQIQVGVLLPEKAVHQINGQPTVWSITPEHVLAQQTVDIIYTDTDTQQVLVEGVHAGNLICLVNLPNNAEGKTVEIAKTQ